MGTFFCARKTSHTTLFLNMLYTITICEMAISNNMTAINKFNTKSKYFIFLYKKNQTTL
ncbi:protein of unknown function [Maridesulfovibrio hydrothermalis AM13 = DSM 14728]|uniref:Uncharacterized protein n=1 Tax=Maridesulfovibrio hydrothermalis AM13 = DSM 14728 TaxID=1121451 RepID=L0RHW3_9BACT|nr:protein of unknown function [Maridesulfovibrio hydrothermalis AM13 = DSM 14728]